MEQPRRNKLKNIINKCRQILEEDFAGQLRKLGIFAEEGKSNLSLEQLTHLSEAAKKTRLWIEQAIQVQQKGDLTEKQAILRYLRHCSFTFLNRIAALRAMEVRNLIEETVLLRDKYGGRSLRGRKFYELKPSLSEGELLELTLKDAFREVGEEINVLFDLNDGFSFFFPSTKMCKDLIQLISVDISEEDWLTDEILGWIYQYFNINQRDLFKSSSEDAKRQPEPDDVPVINQFYTPKWIVQTLVQNTLGRFWLEMNPKTSCAHKWDFFIKTENEVLREKRRLEDIRILDPACGSGHFLIYSFELLFDLYSVSYPEWDAQKKITTILEKNIFGIDIDLRAIQIAALNLYLKVKNYSSQFKITKLNLICADARLVSKESIVKFLDNFKDNPEIQKLMARIVSELDSTFALGSLLNLRGKYDQELKKINNQKRIFQQDKEPWSFKEILNLLKDFEKKALTTKNMGDLFFCSETEKSLGLLTLLNSQYDIILMNPPYGAMPKITKEYVKKNYLIGLKSQSEKIYSPVNDYYAAFILQSYNLLELNGFLGMLTPRSHLFLKTFSPIREIVFQRMLFPEINIDLGFGILDEATTRTAATCLRKIDKSFEKKKIHFCNLTDIEDQEFKLKKFLESLKSIERKPWYSHNIEDFQFITDTPFIYSISDPLLNLFKKFPCLDKDVARRYKDIKIANCVAGLKTADDSRFVRLYWEINKEDLYRRWVFVASKGKNMKYFVDFYEMVDWKDEGYNIKQLKNARHLNEKYYLKYFGLCWPNIASSLSLNVQFLPQGFIFSQTVDAIFVSDFSLEDTFSLLGILNSKVVDLLIPIIDPLKHHRDVYNVAKIPIPYNWKDKNISSNTKEIYDLFQELSTTNELSIFFIKPALLQVLDSFSKETPFVNKNPKETKYSWCNYSISQEYWQIKGNQSGKLTNLISLVLDRKRIYMERIQKLQNQINKICFKLYGLSEEEFFEEDIDFSLEAEQEIEKNDIEIEQITEIDSNFNQINSMELVSQLISYYIKLVCQENESEVVPINQELNDNLRDKLLKKMVLDFNSETVILKLQEIEAILGKSLNDWISKDFFEYHIDLYQKRPIFWQLTSCQCGKSRYAPGVFSCIVYYHKLTPDTIAKIQVNYVSKIRDNLQREKSRTYTQLEGERAKPKSALLKSYQKQYQEVEDKIAEILEFEQRLQELVSPRTNKTILPQNPSWVQEKIAEIRDNGWKPNLDYGVRVNIEPLKELKLLPKVADKVK